ncbi:MAG: heme exporter protein CcmD [Pseudohongiellaceae bacterium]|nr:heme exporter protein CcmD [Pseudohongiellaceae bacterium]
MFDNLAFSSFSEFLQMGKYTVHVWSVYAIFAVFIFVNLFLPRLERKRFILEQKRRALREAQINSARDSSSGENL